MIFANSKFVISPMLLADFYKVSHPFQYPDNTEYVYSNFTARKSRMDGVNSIVVTMWLVFLPVQFCVI